MKSLSRSVILFVLSALAILIIPSFAPMVGAAQVNQGMSSGPRSGRIVAENSTTRINPDPSVPWTEKLNAANGSDYKYLDYNLTWVPFFNNNTDIRGITIHNVLAPYLVNLTTANQSISIGTLFRLQPDAIMDGASKMWFRLPVTDIPLNASIKFRVGRVTDSSTFNVTFPFWSMAVFNHSANVELVDMMDIVPGLSNVTAYADKTPPQSWIGYRRDQSVHVMGNFYYNFTYIKANFALFPNEWYFVLVDIMAPHAHHMKLSVSLGDFGNDGRYNSWIWCNRTSFYFPVDMDFSFVATTGMANGITGIGVNQDFKPGKTNNRFNMNASIPIHKTVDITKQRYFEIIMPFMLNRSIVSNRTFTAYISFYSSADDSVCILSSWAVSSYPDNTATYNFFVNDTDVTAINGLTIDHIRFNIITWCDIYSGGAGTFPRAPMTKLWGTQRVDTFSHTTGFTDLYWMGIYGTSTNNYTMYEKVWFIPFGFFGLTSTHWVNTDQSILVIPVATPNTTAQIREVLQKFEAFIGPHKSLWDDIGKFLTDVALWVLKAAIDTANWVIDHIPGLRAFLDSIMKGLNAIGKFFAGIGLWLYKAITWLIDALQWFTYWMVRIIYSMSLAIVYILNVFGVISINSALFAVTKSGNGKDFVRAFSSGWKFVLSVITLMISLGILAISIVGAVVPF